MVRWGKMDIEFGWGCARIYIRIYLPAVASSVGELGGLAGSGWVLLGECAW